MRVLLVGTFEEWARLNRDDVDVHKVATAADAMSALSTFEPKLMVVDPSVVGPQREALVSRAEQMGCSIIASDRQAVPVKIPGSTIQELEKYAILETLKAVGGSTSKAAKMLGISVRKIQYRLRDWRLRAADVATEGKEAVSEVH
jgi:transcriptional regulator with GAF, ATPase, and Fis domain